MSLPWATGCSESTVTERRRIRRPEAIHFPSSNDINRDETRYEPPTNDVSEVLRCHAPADDNNQTASRPLYIPVPGRTDNVISLPMHQDIEPPVPEAESSRLPLLRLPVRSTDCLTPRN